MVDGRELRRLMAEDHRPPSISKSTSIREMKEMFEYLESPNLWFEGQSPLTSFFLFPFPILPQDNNKDVRSPDQFSLFRQGKMRD
jgi:hypothetical protein